MMARLRRDIEETTEPTFVVAQTDVDYRLPILFRPEPYDAWSWVVPRRRAARSSIESEICDGDTLLSRARVVLVFFDPARSVQCRALSPRLTASRLSARRSAERDAAQPGQAAVPGDPHGHGADVEGPSRALDVQARPRRCRPTTSRSRGGRSGERSVDPVAARSARARVRRRRRRRLRLRRRVGRRGGRCAAGCWRPGCARSRTASRRTASPVPGELGDLLRRRSTTTRRRGPRGRLPRRRWGGSAARRPAARHGLGRARARRSRPHVSHAGSGRRQRSPMALLTVAAGRSDRAVGLLAWPCGCPSWPCASSPLPSCCPWSSPERPGDPWPCWPCC